MEDHHQDQRHRRPYGLLPDLRQCPTTAATASPLPYPPLPHYYPNLLVDPPLDHPIQPTVPSIYSEHFSGVDNNNNIGANSGLPFLVSDAGTAAMAATTGAETGGVYGHEREGNVMGFDLGGLGGSGGGGSRSGGAGGDGGGSSRWPRQETLTLLEIRSRLANKFREANQKGPLWDEVSRIMAEEHRYQRSGKKCREKFENLYKYYKKTKEGKAGRQDGKNYRFFRQLEAIYGESSARGNRSDYPCYDHPPPLDLSNVYRVPSTFENVESENRLGGAEPLQYSPSFSNSMSVECRHFDTSSEEENDVGGGDGELSAIAFMMAENKKMRRSGGSDGQASKMSVSSGSGGRRRGWKDKVKKFVDVQVGRLVEKQEEWMDKMMRTLESNERERVRREIEWKEQESARFERERELWAKERAWMEARDTAFVDAMRKFSGKEAADNYPISRDQRGSVEQDEEVENFDEANLDKAASSQRWQEHEILSFIQVMTSMEQQRQPGSNENTYHREGFWELIEAKMASLGNIRSANECRNKWKNIGNAFRKITDRD
ncbi:hypothetical protein MLD38_011237 [Melastoma candidum]|uniref:Uncharacterized protein n=1 Tax=Melastoma candidum TaxID=119954 RepID=A0ACB9R2G7_9MYRT|nr:hypothetical protein MLD38_011237 [Melastoma candidum]